MEVLYTKFNMRLMDVISDSIIKSSRENENYLFKINSFRISSIMLL